MIRTTCFALALAMPFSGAVSAIARETATLRPGDKGISASKLEPFHATYRQYQRTDGKEIDAGKRMVHLQPARYQGGEGFRYVITMIGAGTVYDDVQFLDSFVPVTRIVSALDLQHQIEVFGTNEVKGFKVQKDGSGGEALELELDGKRFHAGSLDLAIAALPLEVGYQAILPSFSSDFGPQLANLGCAIKVTGKETVELKSGKSYNTLRVEKVAVDAKGLPLKGPNGQPFPTFKVWLIREPPYVVRSEMRSLTIELQSLEQ